MEKAFKLVVSFLTIFSLLFVFSGYVFAQNDIKNYTEQLLNNFDRETTTINKLVDEYQSADFETNFGVTIFKSSISDYKNTFNTYLNFYQNNLSSAPNGLEDSVNFAISGTQQIINGLNKINTALINEDNYQLQGGEDLINGGTKQVNNAIDKYNSWVELHNTQSSEGSAVSADDLGLSSAFSNTIYYGKPLLIVYLYLLVAGFILTFTFRSKLNKFISGGIKNEKFKGNNLYGLHLILLYPYLYALLAFSFLLIWDFALISIIVVFNLERIPIGLIIAIPIVVIGSFIAIIKGFFGGKKRNVLGKSITRKDQPKIWEVCDAVAKEVGTKSLDEIFISPQSGIGVHLSGGLFSLLIGRTKRTLTIGLGSISNLSISQIKAILAHEFGHFSNKDTAWNSLTFTMAAALQNTLSTMPAPWNTSDSGYMKAAAILNPALWALMAYKFLFSVLTSGFSRMREVFADKTAINLYGYKNFTEGLMRVARNDYIFSNYFIGEIIKLLTQEKKIFNNIFDIMDKGLYQTVVPSEKFVDNAIMKQDKSSLFNSHPLLRERLSYASHFEKGSEHINNPSDVKDLFVDWQKISKEMSDLYTYYLAVITGNKKLVDPNICKKCGQEFREGFILPNGLCAECDAKEKNNIYDLNN